MKLGAREVVIVSDSSNRAGGFDIQAYARIVTEDNYNQSPIPTSELDEDWEGYGFTAGWMINERWQPAIQYDQIDASAITAEGEWITAAISYFPLENLRAAAYYRYDGEVDNSDQFFINIRMMF